MEAAVAIGAGQGPLTKPHIHCLAPGTGIQGTWSDHSHVDNKVVGGWDQNHEPLKEKSKGTPPLLSCPCKPPRAAGLTADRPCPPPPAPTHVSVAATRVIAPRVNAHMGVSTSGCSVSVQRAQENGRSQPRHQVASPGQGQSVRL